MNPGIITLTTDFGISGPYVAAVKGVLLEKAPGVQIVDVCHTIAPQNILEGGFVLANIVDAFPAGTVHLAVVDPGVGTERRLIAVSVARQWFVLPDNGLITGVTRLRDGRTRSGRSPARRSGARSSRQRSTGATSWPRPRPTSPWGDRPRSSGRRSRRSSRFGTSSPRPTSSGSSAR